jgi:AcrR family transcriptional regulator
MSDNSRDLAPEVAIAWGLVDRERREARPGLSLERITRAAIAIADEGGLGAISMARVAKKLGFTTMSLYRHVESKEQLLTLMVDIAFGPAPRDRFQEGDWRTGLETWTRSMLESYQSHPWVVDVSISGPPLLPHQLDWMDWALAIMRATPLAPAEQLSTLLLLSGYARNEVRLQADLQRGMAANEHAAEYDDVQYSRDLLRVVPPDRMPALYALIETGLFSTNLSTDVDTSDDVYFFEFGLERILDGLEHYMQSLEGNVAEGE